MCEGLCLTTLESTTGRVAADRGDRDPSEYVARAYGDASASCLFEAVSSGMLHHVPDKLGCCGLASTVECADEVAAYPSSHSAGSMVAIMVTIPRSLPVG